MESTNKKEFKSQKETAETPIDSQNTNKGSTDTDNQSPETDNVAGEAIDWQDSFLRLSAEFDNFRKRTAKEKLALVEGGGEKVLRTFLCVIDDFERALPMVQTEHDKVGMELIYKKFLEILKTNGVTEIDAIGFPLDVDYHEAITQIPVEDKTQVGKVVDVVQKGYMYKDRILRFAKVVVGC